MPRRKSKPVPEPYQAHPCAMVACGRPSHMYCSDGKYYCCVACQMGGVPVVGAAHTPHCDAYAHALALPRTETPRAIERQDSIVSYDTQAPLITQVEYQAFQDAYDFFNTALFGTHLPQVLITLHRRARSKGYFAPERFDGRLQADAVHELALNPDAFVDRSDIEILSTLVHEQVHVWQQTHGAPSRRGYHNREWADHMKQVGLAPSSTGEPGGKETGQQVSHYIVPDGPYAQAYTQLAATGFLLHWESKPAGDQARGKKASKTKYTCPDCGLNAWAKPGAHLHCGDCATPLTEEPS